MAATVSAEVNPTLLAWAREQSGYAPENVAKRLGVKLDRLEAWERGDLKPTVRQAQELAKYYHRPFGVFFLPQPPAVAPLAGEYRRLPGVQPGVESPEFRLAVRVMLQRREVTLELSEELGQSWVEFKTSARVSEGAANVGQRLRNLLDVSVEQQLRWRDEWQAWREWCAAVENAGVLVFQFPKVPLEQARGISLFEFPLPVIGINSRESAPGARAYSLVHELVHVALAIGRDEQVALKERRNAAEWREVERFAEEAASEAIIPDAALRQQLSRVSVTRDAWNIQQVRSLALRFRVTPLAMATRLRSVGAFTWAGYQRWKAQWDELVKSLPTRKGGLATPVDKTLGRAGRPFSQLVLEALDANRITAVDASRYLDLKFDHVEKLRAELTTSRSGGSVTDDSV
jgi:Zn-dependent peptidase ImmA (M78 family)/DNA-binding XRE family transcriptional regulator